MAGAGQEGQVRPCLRQSSGSLVCSLVKPASCYLYGKGISVWWNNATFLSLICKHKFRKHFGSLW